MRISDKIKHAWNAFRYDPHTMYIDRGPSNSRPMHKNVTSFNTSSYVATIFNRIAIDASMTKLKHVKIDPKNEDENVVMSGLHNCLTVEANIDQNYIQFIHDMVYSMFDEGVIAVVPVETNVSPLISGGYDILNLRVGKITQWFPKMVEIELYNENTGINERIVMDKCNVAIIENPLYAVVNGENSTLKRLMRKLSQLDNVDELVSSGRLDLLISVPYAVKTDLQKKMAEDRIASIEHQLSIGRNGIAYIDGTEKVTQLNRPANSQLLESVNTLTKQFYNQLGLTESIFNGTANESELRTYYSRAIDPIMENIVVELTRKFLTKTARTQGHRIVFYRDMFKFVSIEHIATLGDALRRNSIASSNELRKVIGFKHSNDPRADELFNPNIADKNQNSSGLGSVVSPDESQNDDKKDKEELDDGETEEV